MTDVAEIARLLAVYDAAAKDCPARKQFLGYGPCPKCRATPRDGCGLDNRRSNLRICTLSENARNTHSRKGSSSPYLGVSWASRDSKWRAQISLNGRKINVGYFDDETAAARAYDAAARKHFGEYANPNFKD